MVLAPLQFLGFIAKLFTAIFNIINQMQNFAVIDTLNFKKVVSTELITQCIDHYESYSEYTSSTMNKAAPGRMLAPLIELCSSLYNKPITYTSGNYYKHSIPYLPHTDYKSYQNNQLNVVIPLSYIGIPPALVIFDQYWVHDSVTWCMHLPVKSFETNTGVKGCPFEYPVSELTTTKIDNILYRNYLSHYPSYTLDGLSGHASQFNPADIIMFDNRKIHCTSNFKGHKLGISLRFNIE